jgi:hypothetical protein
MRRRESESVDGRWAAAAAGAGAAKEVSYLCSRLFISAASKPIEDGIVPIVRNFSVYHTQGKGYLQTVRALQTKGRL